MHESDRSTVRNGGYHPRCVETPPVMHAFACMDCRGTPLIYNACFGPSPGCFYRWRQPLRCDIYKNPKHEGPVLLHGSFVADAYRLPQSIHVERALQLGVADADAV